MNNIYEAVIRKMAEAAEQANGAATGDYFGEDGLLYCAKCNTPKQYRPTIPILGYTTVPCMCRCETERINRKRVEDELRRKIDNALSDAFESPEMLKWDISEHDDGKTPEVSEAARRYCENFELFKEKGKGLLLWSVNKGSGKSYYAASIVNTLCRNGVRCRMTTIGKILCDLNPRHGYNPSDYIDRLLGYDLLVLDDLGANRTTEWANENIYNVVNGRYVAKKPTIFTTNMSIEEIKNPSTDELDRICDRILKMSHPIHVECFSRRKTYAASDYEETKAILGM